MKEAKLCSYDLRVNFYWDESDDTAIKLLVILELIFDRFC